MATDQNRIKSYYSRFGEWERLETPEGALEFRRACTVLDAHLAPQSRVLDLGGGPGRYAIRLAARGHRVVLADLSAALPQSKLPASGREKTGVGRTMTLRSPRSRSRKPSGMMFANSARPVSSVASRQAAVSGASPGSIVPAGN